MKNPILNKHWITIPSITVILIFFMLNPISQIMAQGNTVGQQIQVNAIWSGIYAGYNPSANTLSKFIGTIIKSALMILGALFMALVVYGGYLWLVSQGDQKMIDKGKGMIVNAAIGVVIVFSAYAITYFIIYNTGIAAQYTTGIPE